MTKLLKDHGGNKYDFEVSDDSSEAKIEEGDTCTVGIVSWPGFPLCHGKSLDLGLDPKLSYTPMHKVIAAYIEKFDRVNKQLTVTLQPFWTGVEQQFNAVLAAGVLPLGKEPIYLLEPSAFDDSDVVTAILREIGNPKSAIAAPEALAAMGAPAAKKIPKGTDADTPVAEVLWQANKLATKLVRSDKEVEAIVLFAKTANKYELNPSQTRCGEVMRKEPADYRVGTTWYWKDRYTCGLSAFGHSTEEGEENSHRWPELSNCGGAVRTSGKKP